MDMFVVHGGVPLNGRATVGGSKNASLPVMAAALACQGETRLVNVPDLVDVRTLSQLLSTLGCDVHRHADNVISISTCDARPYVADYDLVRRMRAGICVLGPLLASRGRACVSLPGGCNIGHRPIDLHLAGLAALGAEIKIERGYIIARANRLRGARVTLSSPCGSTVTGTCNVMVAAALADGITIIESAACEPEVTDLGRFLIHAGANISGLGTPVITISGVDRLNGTSHTVIPDRIEAATLMIAAAITRGKISLSNVPVAHLTTVLDKLVEAGAHWRIVPSADATMRGSTLEIDGADCCRPAACLAQPFPGFPTDLQAQMTSLLTVANGISVVTDSVFPDRFMHASELMRMGANLRRHQNSVVITGVQQLNGASVMASDLRASAALVLAALAAPDESVIRRIYHLDRGYEGLERKLDQLGARVRRVVDVTANIPDSLRRIDAA